MKYGFIPFEINCLCIFVLSNLKAWWNLLPIDVLNAKMIHFNEKETFGNSSGLCNWHDYTNYNCHCLLRLLLVSKESYMFIDIQTVLSQVKHIYKYMKKCFFLFNKWVLEIYTQYRETFLQNSANLACKSSKPKPYGGELSDEVQKSVPVSESAGLGLKSKLQGSWVKAHEVGVNKEFRKQRACACYSILIEVAPV